jgi:hypothetical protein
MSERSRQLNSRMDGVGWVNRHGHLASEHIIGVIRLHLALLVEGVPFALRGGEYEEDGSTVVHKHGNGAPSGQILYGTPRVL